MQSKLYVKCGCSESSVARTRQVLGLARGRWSRCAGRSCARLLNEHGGLEDVPSACVHATRIGNPILLLIFGELDPLNTGRHRGDSAERKIVHHLVLAHLLADTINERVVQVVRERIVTFKVVEKA